MTKKKLKSYYWVLKEIERQEERRQRLVRNASLVSETVRGSSAVFPYTEHTIIIEGFSTESIEKIEKTIEKSIARAAKLREEIENFVDTVEDPRMRELLRTRFIDGKKWQEIEAELFINADYARRIVNKFLDTLQ